MTHARRERLPADRTQLPEVRSAAMPITFGGTVGLYEPPTKGIEPSGLAVLFASPWGLEEMSTRKFWRVISEMLADRGVASLRFDYPGTGDALDDGDFENGLSVWSDSLVAASERLKALSGCQKLVVVAQGLGAVVAAKAAETLDGLEGMAFLAPVVSGRTHVRELAVWSRVVDESLGIEEAQRHRAGVSLASLIMPGAVADEVRKVNLMMIDRPFAPRALVAGRPDRPADAEFSARLQALGMPVTGLEFEGYDQLIANPTISRMPMRVAAGLVEWIVALPSQRGAAPSQVPPAVEPLSGEGFAETPVRFGVNAHLSGVLCEPVHGRSGATVLFLTSAYDRHAGWGRTTVSMARALARSGITSLRFDTANAGDSPPVPGRPEQVLYHSTQNADVSEAIDFLEAHELGPIITAGRCSGAYLGFQTLLAEPRIAGNVSVNPAVFRWRPGRSVEEAVLHGNRNLGDYGKRALRRETLSRLLRGEVDVAAAARNIAKGIGNRIRHKLLYAFRDWLPEGRAIYGAFRMLNQRGTPISLIYSENDLGLEQYDFYFGHDGKGLARFPNISSTIIPNADHNLTPDHARAVYLETLRAMAFRFPAPAVAKSSKAAHAIAAE